MRRIAATAAIATVLVMFGTGQAPRPNVTQPISLPPIGDTITFITASPTPEQTATPTPTPAPTIAPTPVPTPTPRTYQGIAEGDSITGHLTFYCVCETCCGKEDGVTASGKIIWNGMENPRVASCNWLPLGTVITVDGVEYTILDRGGKKLGTLGRLDIYEPRGHEAALKLGRRRGVEIIIVSLPE